MLNHVSTRALSKSHSVSAILEYSGRKHLILEGSEALQKRCQMYCVTFPRIRPELVVVKCWTSQVAPDPVWFPEYSHWLHRSCSWIIHSFVISAVHLKITFSLIKVFFLVQPDDQNYLTSNDDEAFLLWDDWELSRRNSGVDIKMHSMLTLAVFPSSLRASWSGRCRCFYMLQHKNTECALWTLVQWQIW